jgi:adenylate cyclase
MVQIIEQHDGTIDKFIGDAIMAYWGAPLSQADHAKLAMRCLAAMAVRMDELCAELEREGQEPFAIRCGLHSGEVVAGNIGLAGKKMEYTVIGDTVNLASRLEGTAKYYGITYLVGDATYLSANDVCRYRELDKIRVIGRHLPVTIYEPQVGAAILSDAELERFDAALQLYRAHNWCEARLIFQKLALVLPHDKPTQMYIERCDFFIEHPLNTDWDGVFNRAEK